MNKYPASDSTRRPALRSADNHGGFALVIAISLMAFILMLLLSLTAIVKMEIQASDRHRSMQLAREYAKLGALEGLGRLQSLMGPDMRVSANAELLYDNINPKWVGVWEENNADTRTVEDKRVSEPRFLGWLSSHQNSAALDPMDPSANLALTAPIEDQVTIVDVATAQNPNRSVTDPLDTVRVERQAIGDNLETGALGHYAWWVSDENQKALANLGPDTDAPAESLEPRRSLVNLPRLNIDLSMGINGWDTTDASFASLLDLATHERQLSLLGPSVGEDYSSLYQDHFHDLTTTSYGTFTNARDSGLMLDLSSAFEADSLALTPLANDFVYENSFVNSSDPVYKNNGTFSLFPDPGWEIAHDYYNLYKHLDDRNQVPVQTETSADGNDYIMDRDLSPVLLRFIYLHSVSVIQDGGQDKMVVVVDPIVFIHNPHNVAIEFWGFKVLNRSSLWMRMNWEQRTNWDAVTSSFTTTNTNAVGSGDTLRDNTRFWDMWVASTDQGGQGGASFLGFDAILTADGTDNPSEKIRMEPGEIMYFSHNHGTPEKLDTVAYYLSPGITAGYQGGVWIDEIGEKITRRDEMETVPVITGPGVPDEVRIRLVSISDWSDNVIVPAVNYGNPSHFQRFRSFLISDKQGLQDASGENKINDAQGRMVGQNHYWISAAVGPQAWIDDNASNNGWNKEEFTDWIPTDQLINTKEFFHAFDIYMKPATQFDGTDFLSRNPVNVLAHHSPRARFSQGSRNGGQGPNGTIAPPTWAIASHELTNLAQFVTDEMHTDFATDTAFWGDAMDFSEGQNNVVHFSIPQDPLYSLNQLAHAEFSLDDFDPAHAVGNSLASPYLPTDAVHETHEMYYGTYKRKSGYRTDRSYLLNEALYDRFFFSTLAPELPINSTHFSPTKTFEQVATDFSNGTSNLLNQRLRYVAPENYSPSTYQAAMQLSGQDYSAETIHDDVYNTPMELSAAYLLREGLFNVHSTSKEAWIAQLSGNDRSNINYLDWDSGTASATLASDSGAENPFARHSLPGADATDPWSGYRELSDSQIDELAQSIVDEIKARSRARNAPYTSLGSFLNRALNTTPDAQSGVVQAAIEKSTINDSAEAGIIPVTANHALTNPLDNDLTFKSDTRAGVAHYLLQGDVLGASAPYLSVRSDTFRIRAFGNVSNEITGEEEARAWCELLVQRLPEYVDTTDDPWERLTDGTLSTVNNQFGRRFKVISFRWLEDKDI